MPSRSTAQRSATTGHLVITMPLARESLFVTDPGVTKPASCAPSTTSTKQNQRQQVLEVDPSTLKMPDIGNIVKDKPTVPPLGSKPTNHIIKKERENSPDFIDDPDVPPLL